MAASKTPEVTRFEILGGDREWKREARVQDRAAMVFVSRFSRNSLSRWEFGPRTEMVTNRHLLLVPPGMRLAGEGHNEFLYLEPSRAIWDKVTAAFPQAPLPFFLRASNFQCFEIEDHLISLHIELFQKPPGFGLMAESICQKLLGFIFREVMKQGEHLKEMHNLPREEQYRILVNKVIHYIEQAYRDRMSIKDLAARAGMNRTTFCRVFRDLTLESPAQYLLRYRMHKSAEELANSDEALESIVEANGFKDISYFYRAFRRFFRMTPAAYRKWARGEK